MLAVHGLMHYAAFLRIFNNESPMTTATEIQHLQKHGLYASSNEHDACGLGFVAHIKGHKRHDIVTGALIATRPDPSGRFPVPAFEILHRNLADAYPASAEAARTFLQEMPA